MFRKALTIFASGQARPLADLTPVQTARRYQRLRRLTFVAITLGYSFYYTTRGSLAVAKKPLLASGLLSATELGLLGSALLFTYAFGKLCNGLLADRAHIGRFMALGLFFSALLNILFGFGGPLSLLVLLWAANGWFQSMGSAPSVVNITQWFGRREQGTRYSLWSIAHSLGEGMTFAGTAYLVAHCGWQFAFWAPGAVCLIVAVAVWFTVLDRPVTHGLPPVAVFEREVEPTPPTTCTPGGWRQQLRVLTLLPVWIFGLASALLYVARYGLNSWLILYLQEAKGYDLVDAGVTTSLVSVVGVVGTILAGPLSDRFFGSRRQPVLIGYGTLLVLALLGLYLVPPGHRLVDSVAVGAAGFAIGGMLVFLGGLMAVDICPREVTGAATGLVGLLSYLGAAFQDWTSGVLLEQGKTLVAGQPVYSFDRVFVFWIGAALLSLVLTLSLRWVKGAERITPVGVQEAT